MANPKYILKTHAGCEIWHLVVQEFPACLRPGDHIWFESFGDSLKIEAFTWDIESNEMIVWLNDWSVNDSDTLEGWTKGDR
jgi:hypothetical protein